MHSSSVFYLISRQIVRIGFGVLVAVLPSVVFSSSTPLQENFDDGVADGFLTAGYAGVYTLQADSPSGNAYQASLSYPSGNLNASAGLPLDNAAGTAFVVSTKLKVTAWAAPGTSGLNSGFGLFSSTVDFTAGSQYRLLYQLTQSNAGKLQILRNGVSVGLSTAIIPPRLNIPYTLKAVVTYSGTGEVTIKGLLSDDADTISVTFTDSAPLPGTYIGYRTAINAVGGAASLTVRYDDFSVTSLASVPVAGDQSITGSLSVGGSIDVTGDAITLGAASDTYAAGLLYADGELTFDLTRSDGSWRWQHGESAAMTLGEANVLTLAHPDGVSTGIRLDPAGTSEFGSSLLLSGTDNRAPNQTLTDDASLLTVGLANSLYLRTEGELSGEGSAFLTIDANGFLVRSESAEGLIVGNANFADTADRANFSDYADVAGMAYSADYAPVAGMAYEADYAPVAGLAQNADRAAVADSVNISADSFFNQQGILNVGRLGIGTDSPLGSLHIAGSFSGGIIDDGHDRPGLGVSGTYPQVVLMGSGDDVHGATFTLGSYDEGTEGDNQHWSIGTAGQNSRFLDIGHAINELNPHAGIRGFDGSTVMTLLSNGNVGLSVLEPSERLEVDGNVKLSGQLIAGTLGGDGEAFVTVDADGRFVRSTAAPGAGGSGSGNSATADYATTAGTANYATTAGQAAAADTATYADTAGNAVTADHASVAALAYQADYATVAGLAYNADHASVADSVNFSADSYFNQQGILNVGRLGIGTDAPLGRLHVAGSFSGGVMADGHDRPGLGVSGTFPQVVLMANGTDTHGATLMLGSYDEGTEGDNQHWSIGTAGHNSRFLDIGYAANNINPHAGIRNMNGPSVLSLLNNGNVGLSVLEPSERLEVAGNVKLSGQLIAGTLVGSGEAFVIVDADGRLVRSTTTPGSGGSGSGNSATADYATAAGTANYATAAGQAEAADTATYAATSGNADTATHADSATTAATATSATTAGSAGVVSATGDSNFNGHEIHGVARLGIGTSSPSTSLDVVGEAKVTTLTVTGVSRFTGPVRVQRQGDIGMGIYTSGTAP